MAGLSLAVYACANRQESATYVKHDEFMTTAATGTAGRLCVCGTYPCASSKNRKCCFLAGYPELNFGCNFVGSAGFEWLKSHTRDSKGAACLQKVEPCASSR